MKYDNGKPRYDLLPAGAIDDLAKVLTFGAEKYAANSWRGLENGLERYRAALLRHTFAIQAGELIDPESGLPHSAHVMCCAAFINELERVNFGPASVDDVKEDEVVYVTGQQPAPPRPPVPPESRKLRDGEIPTIVAGTIHGEENK